MGRKTTPWTLRATDKRNLALENLYIAKGVPLERN